MAIANVGCVQLALDTGRAVYQVSVRRLIPVELLLQVVADANTPSHRKVPRLGLAQWHYQTSSLSSMVTGQLQ